MMQDNNGSEDISKELDQINSLLQKKTSGVIVFPAKATPDAVAAATGLYLGLLKMGKNVAVVSSETPQLDLQGVDKVKNSLVTGGDNLVVSFPYEEGSIDKVDYNVQNDQFNLIITPREGFPKLDPDKVDFSYTGGSIDFIITIDAPNLNSLGDIYKNNENAFHGKTIINIDRHLINNNYGMINMVAKSSSSVSELVFKVLEKLKVDIDADIATNLYNGILTATNNFTSYSVNADTFDAVAKLMKAGAVKKQIPQSQTGGFGGRPGFGGGAMNTAFNPGGFGGQSSFGSPMSGGFPAPNNDLMNPGSFGPSQPFSPPGFQPAQGSFNPQMNQSPDFPNQQSDDNGSNAESVEQEKQKDDTKEKKKEDTPENVLKPNIFGGKKGLV